jgi:hypothetical protein
VSPTDAPDELGRRLQAALQAEANAVRYDEEAGLDAVRRGGRAARRRRRVSLAGAAATVLLAAALVIPRLHDDRDRGVTTGPDPAPSTTATDPPTTSSTPPDPSTDPGPSTTPSSITGPPETAPPDDGEDTPARLSQPPLWPFRTAAEVDGWRANHRTDGSEPWHLDAEQTALAFTTGYLGFTEIDRVVSSDIGATEAYVKVGYAPPEEGRLSTAANLHLLRWGTGDDAPWEVVGTEDDPLTLDTPRYGATVTSPLTVGGEITGVDESLHVRVLQPSSPAPLGESCCGPAGGTKERWSATVSFSGATDPALTVVVSTGGHVQNVEIFAITAVRTR